MGRLVDVPAAMCANFTDDDVGKSVVNANGDEVGIIASVEHGTAHIEPDPGITDTIKAMLGWEGADEEAYPLQEQAIEKVTDDRVLLKSGPSGASDSAMGTSGTAGATGVTDDRGTETTTGTGGETGITDDSRMMDDRDTDDAGMEDRRGPDMGTEGGGDAERMDDRDSERSRGTDDLGVGDELETGDERDLTDDERRADADEDRDDERSL